MSLRRTVLVCLLCFLPLSAVQAMCPSRTLTPPEKVALKGRAVMIVTHASSNDDARAVTKIGLDQALRAARNDKMQRIYLQDERFEQAYFMDDCQPDYWVYSEGGELRFPVTVPDVVLVGGHLEECLRWTMHDVLLSWAKRPPEDHTMTLVMDAIFSNGKSIEESDPFFTDFQRFMSVVTYGRPGGEWAPKLSLLETMGIIIKPHLQQEYLRRVLPNFVRTLGTGWRVVMSVNDEREYVLQEGQGRRPPLLRFRFLDSAIPLRAE